MKVFRGRKIHGEFDIKVEQVCFTNPTLDFILILFPTRRTETSPGLLNLMTRISDDVGILNYVGGQHCLHVFVHKPG